MRVILDINGTNIIDWKVDCDNYFPDSRGFEQNAVSGEDDVKTKGGVEQIVVMPFDKYKTGKGVANCRGSWTDTLAVTR